MFTDRVLGIMGTALPNLLVACLKVTIPLTILSFVCGMVLALILALVQVANIKGLKQIRFWMTFGQKYLRQA